MISHPYDDIEAYALGALDAQTAASVLEHAEGCATCAVLMADAMTVASALEPQGVRPFAMSARSVARQPRAAAYAWVGAVAAAAAIALLAWNVDLRSNTFYVPIASLVHSHFEHHPLHGASGAGSAKVIQSLDGSWLYIVGDGLATRSTYELDEVVSGQPHEVGTFTTNARGQAAAYWQQPAQRIQAFSAVPVNGVGQLHWP
ncbi:MAG TPA: hypothetical protein VEJ41_02110 [Candidatus Acidoferrales bacterium]|nr:hypothetical protein [Candidatus Acidoferrales bacterium]